MLLSALVAGLPLYVLLIVLAEDRRRQALLIAFSFGALLEGIAGFGAPVAITRRRTNWCRR